MMVPVAAEKTPASSGHASVHALEKELARGLTALGLVLAQEQHDQLIRYVLLMQKWNRVYNLTAIREPQRMLSHHLLDSLAIIPAVMAQQSTDRAPLHVLDVGSGAGLPGIPLAVACPGIDVTMLDSNQKKTAFIQQAVAELQLKNARVECQRVERVQSSQRFKVILSRAFAEISEFVQLAKHLLAPGGVFIAMKGQYPGEEIARLPAAFKVQKVVKLVVPGLDAERHLVFIGPDFVGPEGDPA